MRGALRDGGPYSIEQRRMARPAGCARVHSAVTKMVNAIVAHIVSIHPKNRSYPVSGNTPVGLNGPRQGAILSLT